MKLYLQKNSEDHVLASRLVPDDVTLDAPWVQQSAEATAAWQIEQAGDYAPGVPESVTPRQMRRALNQLGLRAAVEAAVAGGSQNLRDDWEYALELRRDNTDLNDMAAQLGMDAAGMDDLFRLAASFS